MTDQSTKRPPVFKGLRWHREQYFSFFIPVNWPRFDWLDDRQGVLFGPSADDAHTIFAVDLQDLGFSVSVDDLDDLFSPIPSPEAVHVLHRNGRRGYFCLRQPQVTVFCAKNAGSFASIPYLHKVNT